MTAYVIDFPRQSALLPEKAWTFLIACFAFSCTRNVDEDIADREAMERLATGDTQALRSLFDRWKLPLISFLYRSLGSHADAEDLALKTFEKVYRAAPRYRPKARFASWLFAIARNELRHELRRRRRKPLDPVEPEQLEWAAGSETIDPHRHTRELEEELLQALQTLPEKQRSALLLTSANELSPDEIAQNLGMSVNTLYVTLHRARNSLRKTYHPYHEKDATKPS